MSTRLHLHPKFMLTAHIFWAHRKTRRLDRICGMDTSRQQVTRLESSSAAVSGLKPKNTGVLSNGCQCVLCGIYQFLLPFICHFLAWSSHRMIAKWSHCMQLTRDSYFSATRRCLKVFLLQSFSNMVWTCWVGGGETRSPLQFTTDQLFGDYNKSEPLVAPVIPSVRIRGRRIIGWQPV